MPANPGDPLKIPARVWNPLERMVNADQIGATTADSVGPYSAAVILRAVNGGANLEADHVAQFTAPALDPYTVKSGRSSPLVELGDAAWHDSLGQLCVAIDPIPAGKIGRVAVAGVTTAVVDVVSTDHRFASLDPTDPTRLRSSDTGEIKLIGEPADTGERLCLVQLGIIGAILWRYTLDEDFPELGTTVAATLHRLDGTTYGTITLTDKTRSLAGGELGDTGYCRQVGNTFRAAGFSTVGASVVADVRFSDGAWEKQMRVVRVVSAEDPGAWENVITGTEGCE